MFIGVDIGTSSTKGVLINPEGMVQALAHASYDFDRPKPGWSEQDPQVWWSAACSVLGELVSRAEGEKIEAVGLSGQMHGSVFLDRSAIDTAGTRQIKALRKALLWNDQRTAAQCDEIIRKAEGVRAMVEAVGNAPLTGFTLPKILWFQQNEPERFAKLAGVCNPKDFVRLCLTGDLATDAGDASGTLLLDVNRRSWNEDLVSRFGLGCEILPRILESGSVAGVVTPFASGQCGLEAGTLIVAGSGDNQCGGLGAGIDKPGGVLVTLGTSGVVFAHSETCVKDLDEHFPGRLHTMCSATGTEDRPGAWTVTGCMLSAAGSLEWARGVLGPGCSFDELMGEAAAVAPGSDGLLFLGHLTGERCPYADPMARGGWIGLTRSHTRGHMVRSVVEGVSFTLAQVFDLVEGLVGPAGEIRLGGGGAKSRLWRQVLADTLGRDLVSLKTDEGPAHGAALLAAVAGGAFSSIEQATLAAVEIGEVTSPGPGASSMHDMRSTHEALYPALRETMHRLGQG